MASVFDVAKYITHKIGPVTTWKLQKLAYYCQAWSLGWDGVSLFNEDFEAWANGPVCRNLFNIHKGKVKIDEGDFPNARIDIFSASQIETIDTVLETYGDKPPFWLRESTHQEKPWINARGDCPDGELCSAIITKDSMAEYYGSL